MNSFQEIFDQAFRDGIVVSEMPMHNLNEKVQKDILRSLHNSGFNNWLAQKFLVDLDTDNYPTFCTYPNFKDYLREYYASQKKSKAEHLAKRIEAKLEVGLLPSVDDVLPDIDLVVRDVESYRFQFEPHYSLFVGQLNRGGVVSMRDYINISFYEANTTLDMNEIVNALSAHGMPTSDEDIKEFAQTAFASSPLTLNQQARDKIAAFEAKLGDVTSEEQDAQHFMHIAIFKIFINRIITADPDRMRKSFIKVFLEQYLADYGSLINAQMPPEIIRHINNIRAPKFDEVLRELVQEENLLLPTGMTLSDTQINQESYVGQQHISATNVTVITGTNNGNFHQRTKTVNSEEKATWSDYILKNLFWPFVVAVASGLLIWWACS